MLSEHAVVGVHFAGMKEDVRLPEHVRKISVLLEYGWDMPNPIPDLMFDATGIFATLSFGGSPFKTFVPWDAVFAITDKATGHGIVWPSEIPEGLLEDRKAAPPPPAKKPSHLRLVQ
jgi:stringent starvation protein B